MIPYPVPGTGTWERERCGAVPLVRVPYLVVEPAFFSIARFCSTVYNFFASLCNPSEKSGAARFTGGRLLEILRFSAPMPHVFARSGILFRETPIPLTPTSTSGINLGPSRPVVRRYWINLDASSGRVVIHCGDAFLGKIVS